jgi:carboxyl-terminal processing protease
MYKELNPIGSAKITTQKFYRINGGSTQLKGVVPDVIVPDMYKYLDLGEKEMDYAMPWDQIAPAVYDEWVLKNGADLAKIKAKSAARVEKNEVFKMINASAEHLKHKQDNTVQTLSLVKYREELSNSKKEDDKFKDIDKEIADWDFKILKADETTVVDSTKIERNKSFIKTLKKDIYLHEAMGVIKDIRK